MYNIKRTYGGITLINNYRAIVPQDYDLLYKYWSLSEYKASDYTPFALIGWQKDYYYKLDLDEKNGLIWLQGTELKTLNLAPLGDCCKNNWYEILKERFGDEAVFELVPERLFTKWQEIFGERMRFEERRDYWEYLYDSEALATLRGNRYMTQRNRTNRFKRLYEYEYVHIKKIPVSEVLAFQEKWCLDNYANSGEGLLLENNAIEEILSNPAKYSNLTGGAIFIDGKMIAYTIGEIYGDILYVHFEKADTEYQASYQMINREFVSDVLTRHPEVKLVNREEDLGDEGLRRAKMNYKPVDFIKKYFVKIDLR